MFLRIAFGAELCPKAATAVGRTASTMLFMKQVIGVSSDTTPYS